MEQFTRRFVSTSTRTDSRCSTFWRDLVNTESGTTQIDGVNAVCSILREMENADIHTRVRAIQNSGDMLIGEWKPRQL